MVLIISCLFFLQFYLQPLGYWLCKYRINGVLWLKSVSALAGILQLLSKALRCQVLHFCESQWELRASSSSWKWGVRRNFIFSMCIFPSQRNLLSCYTVTPLCYTAVEKKDHWCRLQGVLLIGRRKQKVFSASANAQAPSNNLTS